MVDPDAPEAGWIEIPEADLDSIMAEMAKAQIFAEGPLERGQLEYAAAGIMRALNTRPFLSMFGKMGTGNLIPPTTDDWWEGLDALCHLSGRLLTEGIGAMLKHGQKVDAETLGAYCMVKLRGLKGPDKAPLPFPKNRTEDPVYTRLWAEAMQALKGNLWYENLETVAMAWDTLQIPLRYFSDSAALALLNAVFPRLGRPQLEIDTYRKDIRGNRRGLGLNAPTPERTIVKWLHREPSTLRVNAQNARRVGFKLDQLEGDEFVGFKLRVV